MIKQSSIEEKALPSALDPENALRIPYKTNLLMPLVGPYIEARAIGVIGVILRDMSRIERILVTMKEYLRRHGTALTLPQRHAPLDPIRYTTADYVDDFVTPVRDVLRAEQLANLSRTAILKAAEANLRTDTSSSTKRTIAKNRDRQLILHSLSMPNTVLADLFRFGLVEASGTIFQESLLAAERPLLQLAQTLREFSERTATAEVAKQLAPFVRHAAGLVDQTDRTTYIMQMNKDELFLEQICIYVAAKLKPTYLLQALFPITYSIDPHREWAIQRYEEMRLALGTPFFRGPVAASPVAPKSQRTITETQTYTSREVSGQMTASASRTYEGLALVTAERFQSQLDNLSEHGIADETEFANDSTLLSTLNEERRQAVETVSREISSEAQNFSGVSSSSTAGHAMEYTTEGKDPKVSTTELQFQVVVPAQATVMLRDVGLVWCPRVGGPFIDLRTNVLMHMEEAKAAYIQQHYVPMPVKPAIKTETKEYVFEVRIYGTDYYQQEKFSVSIPFYDESAFIDLDGITAAHRNGTSDDYDGLDLANANGDDLEHAVARLKGLQLSADGHTLSGYAVLETNDPEAWNVSFITIKVPILSYTAETAAALAEYEQEVQERDLKLQVIYSRADQYARLKRDELIEQYERVIGVEKEAFRALVRRIFKNVPKSQLSYYEEVLSRCINWDEASMTMESQHMDKLFMRHLAPDHFMNSPGARFFLPISKNAEELFFETINMGGYTYYQTSASKARKYLTDYRDKIEGWKTSDEKQLQLDQFETEMIIGKHLEAVLGQYDFSQ